MAHSTSRTNPRPPTTLRRVEPVEHDLGRIGLAPPVGELAAIGTHAVASRHDPLPLVGVGGGLGGSGVVVAAVVVAATTAVEGERNCPVAPGAITADVGRRGTSADQRPLRPENAELVSLRIGQHDPGLVAGLSDVYTPGTKSDNAADLCVPVVSPCVATRV